MSGYNCSNDTDTSQYVFGVNILISVLTGLLSLFGVVGNVLILMAIIVHDKLHRQSSILVFSLTLADLAASGWVGPASIVSYHASPDPWPSLAGCRLMLVFGIGFSLTSCFFVAFISLNGLLGVLFNCKQDHPVHAKILVIFLTVFGWVSMTFVSLPLLFGFGNIYYEPVFGTCFISADATGLSFLMYLSALTVLTWMLSLTCYLKILKYVRNSRRRVADGVAINASSMPNLQRARFNKDRAILQLVSTMIITFITYLAMSTPLIIITFSVRLGLQIPDLIWRTACVLYWGNSTLNPYIYTWRLREFRAGLTKVAKKFRRCNLGTN